MQTTYISGRKGSSI